MKVGVWSHYATCVLGNRMFLERGCGLGDDALYGTNELYKACKTAGIELASLDALPDPSAVDAMLVFDYPKPMAKKYSWLSEAALGFKGPKILILHECEVIKPNNWIRANHEPFDRILTWHDGWVDNKRYFKLNMPPRVIPKTIPRDFESRKLLCAMLGGNKGSNHPLELYSERLRCIEWFERFHPHDFRLYGARWDRHVFDESGWWTRKLNRITPLARLLGRRYRVWHGTIPRKEDVLGKCRFNMAYENARDIPGYILEKIFDPMLCGCIPVYRGADNVGRHVPEMCFVDQRKYPDYGGLYDMMMAMTKEQYMARMDAIEGFIYGEGFYPFSVECYVKTVMEKLASL